MALGGLLESLVTPVPVSDGFDGTINLTHRAYTVSVGIAKARAGAADPAVCVVKVCLGKVVNNDFREHPDAPAWIAHLTLSELKALSSLTIANIIAAAKTKLGLTE